MNNIFFVVFCVYLNRHNRNDDKFKVMSLTFFVWIILFFVQQTKSIDEVF